MGAISFNRTGGTYLEFLGVNPFSWVLLV